jgi:hypothetical protein
MGLISILGHMVQKRNESPARPVIRTETPLNLSQGAVVDLPDVDIALAQVDGSIISVPSGTQLVISVGTYRKWGLTVHNCYLSNGSSFIQLVTDAKGKIVECKLWSSHNQTEILPQTVEDWEFWLGSYHKDADGGFIRDAQGRAIRREYGLIGWPQFQVDGPPAIVYNRAWSPSEEGVDPVGYTEIITDDQGRSVTVKHEAMEYARRLTDAADAVTESLLATMVQDQDGAAVNIFIGIPLDHQTLKILQS